jgi:hypothetical protein
VPTLGMPDRPDIDSFRRQARALQRAVRAGDAGAVARLARYHPGGVPDDASGLQLSAAQLVAAREYGFASWPGSRGTWKRWPNTAGTPGSVRRRWPIRRRSSAALPA